MACIRIMSLWRVVARHAETALLKKVRWKFRMSAREMHDATAMEKSKACPGRVTH